MIRGRKEGSNYATWFIGFDHDDTLGLPAFTELPNQKTSVPTSNRPSLRATSLESILPAKPPRSVTPIGTQTHTPYHQAGQPISTQTSADVGHLGVQAETQTTAEENRRPRTVSTGTGTGVELDLDRKTPTITVSKAVETAGQQTSPQEEDYRGLPLENGERRYHNGKSEPRSERISSVTETSTEPVVRSRTNSNSGNGARPRSENFDSQRDRRRRDRETKGLYREAFDGAKRAEEFKFRVKFDQFLGDLHNTLDERSPQGLPASFASPSYGEVMLLFRDKVKDLLRGFTHRLQLAHESFCKVESPDDTAQKVKQDVSKFIEDLIGETLDLTSDEAVSDLSSLSDEASPDQSPTFEDLLAQAVVTKLLENHRKAVRDSIEPGNDNERLSQYNNNNPYSNNYSSNHHSFDHSRLGDDQVDNSPRQYSGQGLSPSTKEHNRVRNFISLDQDFVFEDRRDFQSADGGSRDPRGSGDIRGRSPHPRDVFSGNRQVSVTSQHTDSSRIVDSGGIYSRTLSNRNFLNTSAEQDNLLIPDSRLSSDEDEEGGVRTGDKLSDRSRNNSGSSNNNHLGKTSKQHSASSTSSIEPEIITRDCSRDRHRSNINSNHSNNDSLPSEDHQSPTAELGAEKAEARDKPESEPDPERDFLELKDFVRRTQQQARPKPQARELEELAEQVEVKEEELLRTSVNRDEEREQFHARYSVFDRVHNAEPALPDFSQFENIDFSSSEIDPDLLSMNLAIIPEETEEELEQEEEEDGEDGEGGQGKWRNNWIFKGKGLSAYDNMGKKKVGRFDQDGPLIMMVPRPEDDYVPRVGNRDIDQLSDFSEGDLLTRSDLDNTDDDNDSEDDDDENSFYANTSKELARIAKRRLRSSRDRKNSGGSRFDNKLIPGLDKEPEDLDFDCQQDQALEDIPGPIVEPVKPEVKLLYDLIPAEGDDPKFLSPPDSVTIQEGEPVQFSCRVGGTQPYDVFWYREGDEVEELEEGEDVELGNTGDKYWMNLYHVGHKQAGQYMCIALSDKGKAIQYLVITVKDNKQDLKKPEFLKGLKDVEVTEGESVKFRVKVKGYPQPRVTWFKDGQILKPSRSCRIEKFGNRDYILTIDYATMDDDAEYTVSARNVAGTEKLSAQVIVEPRSELPPRRQIMSSLNTSAASDSDSDFAGGYKRRSYNLVNNKPASSSSPQLVAARRRPSPTSLTSPLREQQQRSEDEPLSPSTQSLRESELMSQDVSSLIESLPPSLMAASSPRTDMQEKENELHINHLDRKVTLTQKRVEEEADKMQEDSKKLTKMTHTLDDVDDRLASLEVSLPSFAAFGRDWALNNRNLWTELNADRGGEGEVGGKRRGGAEETVLGEDENATKTSVASKDIMAAADEILKLETAGPDSGSVLSAPAENVNGQTDAAPAVELDLPDELEDFPLPGLPAKSKATPVKSTFTLSVGRKNSSSGSESEKTRDGKSDNDADVDDVDWGQKNKSTSRDKFKSEVSFPQTNKNNNNNSIGNASSTTPPISPLQQRQHTVAPPTANLNNLSFDSGQGGSLAGGDNSASLASSVSSSTSSLGGPAGEVEDGQLLSPSSVKGRYARDFDVTSQQQQLQLQQQKKKWSVTLGPFSPQAEVVNKQTLASSELKTPEVEIHEADLSGSSGRSSPSLANPSLARPPPRERAAPVHMVGTTSEAEVPESRTEFNTDGSVELPSVNRLKALFSGNKDDMLGDGNFKRAPEHDQVHSITARSVSKKQLEKLRTNNQNESSSSSSSLIANRQRSPLAMQQPSASPLAQKAPSTSLQLNSTLSQSTPSLNSASSADSSVFASQVTLRPIPAADPPQQAQGKPQRRRSQIEDGSYLEIDADKDPVLIYPEKDPEYWRRQHKLLLQEHQQQQQSQQVHHQHGNSPSAQTPSHPQVSASTAKTAESSPAPSIKTVGASPGQAKSSRPQQPRLVVRRATADINLDALEVASPGGSVVSPGAGAGSSGGTRIKAGCISARAAFWEKKMMDGGEGVDDDEFPEMVEESDS